MSDHITAEDLEKMVQQMKDKRQPILFEFDEGWLDLSQLNTSAQNTVLEAVLEADALQSPTPIRPYKHTRPPLKNALRAFYAVRGAILKALASLFYRKR